MYKLVTSADAGNISFYEPMANQKNATKMPTLYKDRNYYLYNDYNYIKGKVRTRTTPEKSKYIPLLVEKLDRHLSATLQIWWSLDSGHLGR
jgi:hypothetical protein